MGVFATRSPFRPNPIGLSSVKLVGIDLHTPEGPVLYVDEGYIFGKGGEGFERINIACPRHVLEAALVRLKNALDEYVKNKA